MRTTAMICALVASAGMAGCMSPRVLPQSAFQCTKYVDCAVTVSVSNSCVITVDKPDIEMKNRDLLIRWQLDEASIDAKFRFDHDKGIVFKASSPAPGDQFYDKAPQGGGLQYHMRDKNSNYETYDYEINIFQKNSTLKCKLDPRVINN